MKVFNQYSRLRIIAMPLIFATLFLCFCNYGYGNDTERKALEHRLNPMSMVYRLAVHSMTVLQDSIKAELDSLTETADSIYCRIRSHLNQMLPFLCEFWYGTNWDYNGVSVEPGSGKIACGYFVANILHDLGFKFSRNALGRLPASKIIRTFIKNDSLIKTINNKEISRLEKAVKQMGKGVFLIGLDYHVGFLLYETDSIYFIHSSFFTPQKVVKENIHKCEALRYSDIFMIGKLFCDDLILKKWLYGREINVLKHDR